MSIDIIIHSSLSVSETNAATKGPISELKEIFGERFWISEFKESSNLD